MTTKQVQGEIIFSCENCGTDIVKDSREHDDCYYSERRDEWFCGDCKEEEMENDDEEVCEYCECDLGQCECVKCFGCESNITELVDDCAEQGEGDWAHPCVTCGEKCGRLYSFAPDCDSETIDFLLTKGWKKSEEFAHQLVRSN